MQKKNLIKKVLQSSRETVHSGGVQNFSISELNSSQNVFQTRRLKLNLSDSNTSFWQVKQNQKPSLLAQTSVDGYMHSTQAKLELTRPIVDQQNKLAFGEDNFKPVYGSHSSSTASYSEARHYKVVAKHLLNTKTTQTVGLSDRFFTAWIDKNTGLGLGQTNLVSKTLRSAQLLRLSNSVTTGSLDQADQFKTIKHSDRYASIKGLSLDLTQTLFFDHDATFLFKDTDSSRTVYDTKPRLEEVTQTGLTTPSKLKSSLIFSRVSRPEGSMPLSLNLAHPQQYSNLLGYRANGALVNPYVTLQSIRRFLHYLKNVLSVNLLETDNSLTGQSKKKVPGSSKLTQSGPTSSELIIVLESSLLSSLSKQYVASLRYASIPNAFGSKQAKLESSRFKQSLNQRPELQPLTDLTTYSKSGATDLLFYCLLRLLGPALALNEPSRTLRYGEKCLKISLKTAKETISYLAHRDGTHGQNRSLVSTFGRTTEKPDLELVGVLMVSPAKSVLGTIASQIFTSSGSNRKKVSTANALGFLCSKKGIPLISLCDITSPVNFSTYPIICDTSNINSLYVVFDLLTYGLNKIARPKAV